MEDTSTAAPDPGPEPAPPRRRFSLSIQSKLLMMLLGVSILSTLVAGVLGYRFGTALLEAGVNSRLVSLRATRAARIESYFETLRAEILTDSEDPTVIAALGEFAQAYRQLEGQTLTPEQEGAIAEFYRTSYLPRLQQNVEGRPAVDAYLPVAPGQKYLQYHYTISGDDWNVKVQLDDPGDGSAWTAVHRRYQPYFRNLARRLAFDDLMFIDSATGTVVYSTYKGHDLGTNLVTGVYADSALGRAFREARRSDDREFVRFYDYEAYRSSYNAPYAFVVGTVYDGPRQIGVLAVQLTTAAVDDVVTGGGTWERDGLGKTGECIVVGSDGLMRSQSRLLQEDPQEYRRQVVANGLPPQKADRIVRLKSTILEQPITGPGVQQASQGVANTAVVRGYRGRELLAAGARLGVPELNWVLSCSQEVSEALTPASQFARQLGVATVGLVVGVTLIALLLAQAFVRPIRRLAAAARSVGAGDLDTHVPVTARDELGELGESFNAMARSLRQQRTLIREQEGEIDRILRTIMPGAVARRFRAGEQQIVGQHQNVAVLYADVRGFPEHAGRLPPEQGAALLNRLIGAFDDAAERHGVEKFKTIGADYLAVCGLSVPRVDNARRAVDCAREMGEIVERFNREHGTGLTVHAAIDSGTVTAGIVGREKFVYDMWGDTVSRAFHILDARPAGAAGQAPGGSGTILVTRAVADRLQGIYDCDPVGEIETRGGGREGVFAVRAEGGRV